MTPFRQHLTATAHREDFTPDDAQKDAVAVLDRLFVQLTSSPPSITNPKGFWDRLRGRRAPPTILLGAYLWGGVGRGKTRLMDLFFDVLPIEQKTRMHFQRFMRLVHHRLKAMPKYPDPLPVLAKELADKYRLIGFDEFHVDDVADAMLLSGLLHGLIENGVIFVFTSNLAPDELYLHGLQRERFLPAIDLIKRSTEVVHLSGKMDYRRASASATLTGFLLESDAAKTDFGEWFAQQAPEWLPNVTLEIHGRMFPARAVGGGHVWFDFATLCRTNRSSVDFLELCDRFHTWFISGISVMGPYDDDVANRFIQLIDALYDHKVQLYACAHVPLDQLYQGRRLAFAFARTTSRLSEMLAKN